MRHAIGVRGAKFAYRIQMFKQATCNLARWLADWEVQNLGQVGARKRTGISKRQRPNRQRHVGSRERTLAGDRLSTLDLKLDYYP
jgi:hypothetical protein